jgi:dihydropteridine reductase
LGVRVIGADVVEPSGKDEQYLKGGFVELPTIQSSETTTEPSGLSDLTMALTDGLYQLLEGDDNREDELDAVICVAGAWEGDPPHLPLPTPLDDDESEDPSGRLWLAEGAAAYAENIDRMMGKNLYPVLAAGYASQHYMTAGGVTYQDEYGEFTSDDNDGGLFVAIGATAALGGTPGMLGYGLSKVATHHFLQTLGETTGKAVTHKSKRKSTRRLRIENPTKYLNKLSVVGILPTTIDTPANREAMPDANFDDWTKSIDIAKEIGTWLREPALRPHSGSLIKVHPKKNGGGAEFRVAR